MEQKNITKDMTGYGQKADVKELAVMISLPLIVSLKAALKR